MKKFIVLIVLTMFMSMQFSSIVTAKDKEDISLLFSDDTIELYLHHDKTLTVKGYASQGETNVRIHLYNPYASEEFGNPFEGEVDYDFTIAADGTFEFRTPPVNYKSGGTLTFEEKQGYFYHEAIKFSMVPLNIDDYKYEDYQLEFLGYINTIRAAAGLSELKLNGTITEAAKNHANYLAIHKTYENGLDSHSEDKTKEGFTGYYPAERLSYYGLRESVSEIVMPYGVDSAKEALDSWLDTAYHRVPLMNPNAREFGIAIVDGRAVLNMVDRVGAKEISVYPYNGMRDVDLNFTGNENPNPIEKFDIERSGYIISFQHPLGAEIIQASITNSNGDKIPFYLEDDYTWFLYPAFELSYDDTYTVSVDYTVEDKQENITWSFHTIKEPEYLKNTIRININGKVIAPLTSPVIIENDRTYVPLRGVFERLNASLLWEPASNSAFVNTQDTSLQLTIGDKIARVNGKEIMMERAPFLRNGRTYVPLRFISEAIGADVKWDEVQNMVLIQSKLGQPVDLTNYVTEKMEARFKPVKAIGEKYGYKADNSNVEMGWYSLDKNTGTSSLFLETDLEKHFDFNNRITITQYYSEMDTLAFTVLQEIIEVQTSVKFDGLDEMLIDLINRKQNEVDVIERNAVQLQYRFEVNDDSGQFVLYIEY